MSQAQQKTYPLLNNCNGRTKIVNFQGYPLPVIALELYDQLWSLHLHTAGTHIDRAEGSVALSCAIVMYSLYLSVPTV